MNNNFRLRIVDLVGNGKRKNKNKKNNSTTSTGKGKGKTSTGKGTTSTGKGKTSTGKGTTSTGKGTTSTGKGTTSTPAPGKGTSSTSTSTLKSSLSTGKGTTLKSSPAPPSLLPGKGTISTPASGKGSTSTSLSPGKGSTSTLTTTSTSTLKTSSAPPSTSTSTITSTPSTSINTTKSTSTSPPISSYKPPVIKPVYNSIQSSVLKPSTSSQLMNMTNSNKTVERNILSKSGDSSRMSFNSGKEFQLRIVNKSDSDRIFNSSVYGEQSSRPSNELLYNPTQSQSRDMLYNPTQSQSRDTFSSLYKPQSNKPSLRIVNKGNEPSNINNKGRVYGDNIQLSEQERNMTLYNPNKIEQQPLFNMNNNKETFRDVYKPKQSNNNEKVSLKKYNNRERIYNDNNELDRSVNLSKEEQKMNLYSPVSSGSRQMLYNPYKK